MAGHIRCAVCETRRNEAVCPRCGSPKCYIYIYWKGKEYKFRRFHVDGWIFDYERALRQLTNMRTEMDKRSFNPVDWLPQKARERKFEHQAELWLAQKEAEEKRDEFSPETLKNYKGYVETGLRPGELCALKVKDLDMKGHQAVIQRTWSGSKLRETTKGKSKKWIPLSDRALEIAMRHIPDKHPEAFLFVNPKTMRGYRPKTLNNLWKAFSGLQTVHYEASRHSFCTQIVESGADVLQARELMRHANIRSTQRYFHGSIKRLRDIVNSRGKIISFRNPSGKAQEGLQ